MIDTKQTDKTMLDALYNAEVSQSELSYQADYLREHLPQVVAMEIVAGKVDQNYLSLQAPLEPNINDKLTAFGGSLSALATLTGWAMTAVLAQRYPQSCDIVVTQTKTDFLLPVKDKIISARLLIPNAQTRKDFGLHLFSKGRAKLVCEVEIITEKGLALVLLGTYLARINAEQKGH